MSESGTKICAAQTLASLHDADTMAMACVNGEIGMLEEILGFAVIVEGIVFGVYSSTRESDYIANSLRGSGLICEICRYE